MSLPFTVDQFLQVFRSYNTSVFPAQIVFYAIAMVFFFMMARKPLGAGKFGSAFLAFLWLWMGVVYHLIFFTSINKVAYIFGAAFVLQGLLIFWHGVVRNRLVFRFQADAFGIAGAVFILLGLVLYPLLSYARGHVYPESPTFGLPCPTTIFTFGMFLWTYRHFPKVLVIIPLLWSFVGFTAAFSLGMVEDTTLIVTGIVASAMLIFRKREWTKVVATVFFMVLFLHPLSAQQTYAISFTHDGLTVNGTFTTPMGTGPFPTIIINPGTGANDRNGTIPVVGGNFPCLYPHLVGDTLRPYKQLGDALTDSGYAVLRYDKLEFTYHPSALGPITFHKLWLPVESAIDYVKTRDDVDTNRIILIGHSEGSSLIPFIAHGRSDIAALISIAGPRSPLDTLLAHQLRFITRECGGDTVAAEFQISQIYSYFNVIRTNMWNVLTPSLFGVPASAWYDYILAVDSVAINYNLNILPTLFIGFGLDINVPPAELDRLQQEVIITDDFWRLPDLVHFMTTSDEPDVPMVLTDTIIYWLRQNVQTGVNEHEEALGEFVHVSPNPFHTELNILIDPVNNDPCDLSIISSEGHKIYWKQLPGNTDRHSLSIDLSFAPAGVYYVKVLNAGARSVAKVIKLE